MLRTSHKRKIDEQGLLTLSNQFQISSGNTAYIFDINGLQSRLMNTLENINESKDP